MTRSVRLRPWQKAALDAFWASPRADFLAVATPGAGKTTFALTAARQALAAGPGRDAGAPGREAGAPGRDAGAPGRDAGAPGRDAGAPGRDAGASGREAGAPGRPAHAPRLIVVAPTQHLKVQWARNAAAFDLHLEPQWSAADGRLPADMHGVVTTYQQVATSALALRQLAAGAFVVFDELHHAGDERAWGAGIQTAFEVASRRLALSGTPFRSDTIAIPFVRYSLDVAQPDFEYGYGEALSTGGVVRPVFFPRIDGHMEWMAPDGSLHAAGFSDPLDRARAGQRLRTALSLEGEWLPAVLRQAHAQLQAVRAAAPDAAGLVIAMDQEHARGIGAMLRERFGVRATVVTSDDPTASARIAAFAAGTDPWIVAVRMVSEGVDIPRLHVGVYATTTTTELFFRQAVGRIVRWTRGERRQRAYLFIPDDIRLRALAYGIAEQRRHSLVRVSPSSDPVDALDPVDPLASLIEPQQLSLFAALSAVTIGDPHDPAPADLGLAEVGLADLGFAGAEDEDDGVEVDLPPLPVAGPRMGMAGPGMGMAGPGMGMSGSGLGMAGPGLGMASSEVPGQTLRERKKALRDDNAERARRIARLTGLTHAQVNRELNRLAGLDRITEATSDQLERRLRHADGWLRKVLPTPPGLARNGA